MKRICSLIIIIVLFVLVYCESSSSICTKVSALNYNFEYFSSDECELLVVHDVENVENFLSSLNIEIRSRHIVSDRVIIEGFFNNCNKYLIIDGLKTNIQLSFTGDELIIGVPLIMGSF